MNKFIASVVFLVLGTMLSPHHLILAEEAGKTSSPLNEVQLTLDEVIKVVEAIPEESKANERRSKLREIINPRFDFVEMSKRSLGTYWNSVNEEQQREFVHIFSDLLARTYLSKIETVKRGMVNFDSEKIDFPRALVRTSVRHKGDVFPIDYKLVNEQGTWRVYDVIIENIGLVINYRNEFAGIIRKEKFEGLMKRLKERNKI